MQQSCVTFITIPLSLVSKHRIDETLPTAFLDSDSTLLEKNEERDRVINSLCEDYTVWSNILEESVEENKDIEVNVNVDDTGDKTVGNGKGSRL